MKLMKFLQWKSKSSKQKCGDSIINVNSIEELDDLFHEEIMRSMREEKEGEEFKPSKPMKVILGKKLTDMGMENITQILMMRCIDRALNDPEIKNMESNKPSRKDYKKFENTIYPLVWDKNATYH